MLGKYSEKKFFPYYFFEVTVTALLIVETVLVLAALFPQPVGREIDFSAQYSPRPEWYFLFLYELTKYFPGRWTFIGAVLLPGLAFGIILLAPFLDKGQATAFLDRKSAAVAGFVILASIILLTVLALL